MGKGIEGLDAILATDGASASRRSTGTIGVPRRQALGRQGGRYRGEGSEFEQEDEGESEFEQRKREDVASRGRGYEWTMACRWKE